MRVFAWFVVAVLPGFTGANDKAPSVDTKVASFTLRDYRGAETSLEQFAAKKAVVLAFVGCDCPVAKLYGPRWPSWPRSTRPKACRSWALTPISKTG